MNLIQKHLARRRVDRERAAEAQSELERLQRAREAAEASAREKKRRLEMRLVPGMREALIDSDFDLYNGEGILEHPVRLNERGTMALIEHLDAHGLEIVQKKQRAE